MGEPSVACGPNGRWGEELGPGERECGVRLGRGRELGRCAPGGPRGELGWVGEGKRRWAGSGNDWAGPQGLDGFLVLGFLFITPN